MISVTIMFCFRTTLYQMVFLWKDGELFKPKTWWRGFQFYFVKPGMLRKIFRDYLDYFRRDFHPWDHDNRELLGQWLAEQQQFKAV